MKSVCGSQFRLGLLWVSKKNAGFSFVSVPLVRFLLWPHWLFPIVPWPEVSRFSVKVLATRAVPLGAKPREKEQTKPGNTPGVPSQGLTHLCHPSAFVDFSGFSVVFCFVL